MNVRDLGNTAGCFYYSRKLSWRVEWLFSWCYPFNLSGPARGQARAAQPEDRHLQRGWTTAGVVSWARLSSERRARIHKRRDSHRCGGRRERPSPRANASSAAGVMQPGSAQPLTLRLVTVAGFRRRPDVISSCVQPVSVMLASTIRTGWMTG
jgi:hypothetical protein